MNITEISKEINEINHEKGFWDKGIDVPQKLMLIVSELAEAMEADREGRQSPSLDGIEYVSKDEFPNIFEENIKSTYQDELADVAIRLFDLAYEQGIDLEHHIRLKVDYNKTRPHMHGKKY